MRTSVKPGAKWRALSTSLLDGDFPWGAIITSRSRYGAGLQRLVVYPPGMTLPERRWLRLWRGWPLWGGLVWFVLQIWLLHVTGPWSATAISCSVVAVAGAATYVMAGDNRSRVQILAAPTFATFGDRELVEGQRILRLLATTLVTAHGHHLRGELSNVDYERVWWEVYNAMAAESRARARPRRPTADPSKPVE